MIDMTKLESIEKLRELACDINGSEIVDHMQLYPSCVFDGAWLDSWHCEFDRVLEALEREIAEKYMLLPVDADGVPIHVGDHMQATDDVDEDGKPYRQLVTGYTMSLPDGNGKLWFTDDDGVSYDPRYSCHVKPDPVKELLCDMIHEYGCTDALTEAVAEKYAERIRELMEVDDG